MQLRRSMPHECGSCGKHDPLLCTVLLFNSFHTVDYRFISWQVLVTCQGCHKQNHHHMCFTGHKYYIDHEDEVNKMTKDAKYLCFACLSITIAKISAAKPSSSKGAAAKRQEQAGEPLSSSKPKSALKPTTQTPRQEQKKQASVPATPRSTDSLSPPGKSEVAFTRESKTSSRSPGRTRQSTGSLPTSPAPSSSPQAPGSSKQASKSKTAMRKLEASEPKPAASKTKRKLEAGLNNEAPAADKRAKDSDSQSPLKPPGPPPPPASDSNNTSYC